MVSGRGTVSTLKYLVGSALVGGLAALAAGCSGGLGSGGLEAIIQPVKLCAGQEARVLVGVSGTNLAESRLDGHVTILDPDGLPVYNRDVEIVTVSPGEVDPKKNEATAIIRFVTQGDGNYSVNVTFYVVNAADYRAALQRGREGDPFAPSRVPFKTVEGTYKAKVLVCGTR